MKSRIVRVVLFFLVAISLSTAGCNDESIKVMFDKYESQGGRIENLKTVAILNFDAKDKDYGVEIAEMVTEKMYQFGYFEVLDRETSLKTLREKGLPTGGAISGNDLTEIAGVLGADLLIYGDSSASFSSAIMYYNQSSYPYGGYYYRGRRYDNYYYNPVRVPYLNRRGKVKINVHFFDSKINKEIGQIDLQRNYNKDFRTYYSLNNLFFFDEMRNSKMPSDNEMIVLISERLVSRLIDGFTPYYISKIRVLQEDIAGAEQAKNGKWDEAKNIWEKDQKIMPVEWKIPLNLGIYYERQGNAARAHTYYQQASLLAPDNEMLSRYAEEAEEVSRIKNRMAPVKLSKEQIRYKISDVKEDGRIYINAGEEDGAAPGQAYTVFRKKMEFGDDLTTPRGVSYYPIAEITLEKVFEGVSQGKTDKIMSDYRPHDDDAVILKE